MASSGGELAQLRLDSDRIDAGLRRVRSRQGWPAALEFDFNQGPEGSAAGLRVFDRSSAAVTMANTTTETTLYSVTIPQLAMGLDGRVRILVHGTFRNFRGATTALTFRLNFGGAVAWQDTAAAVANDTDTRMFRWDIDISNRNALDSQIISAILNVSEFSQTPAAGFGAFDTTGASRVYLVGATTSVDTRNQPVFSLTGEWGTADAATTMTVYKAIAEILP